MKRKGKLGVSAAAAAALAGVGLMIGLFAAGENAYKPLETLPPSMTAADAGHSDPQPTETGETESASGTVNINTAGLEELDTLPGIGPVKAAAIIAWREEHGPFRYPEQLLEVSGIGEKTLEGLIDLIRTGDE